MRFATIAFVVSGVTAVATVQQPNLNATWVATKDAPADLPASASPLFGERVGLAVAADQLTFSRPGRGIGGTTLVSTHPMNGSPSPLVIPGRQCFGDAVQSVSVTRHTDGFDFLMISNTPPGSPTSPVGLTYRFRLVSADRVLVESTQQSPQGTRQVGTIYARTADPLPPPMKAPNVMVAPAAITAVGWLSGDWVATVGNAEVEERWFAPASGSMIGVSRTTRGKGTLMAEFEHLCITQRAGGLVYTATPNGTGTTDFLLTKVTADSVTFENPDHDFPTSIVYTRRADEGYDVTISGAPSRRSLTYSFKKK